MTNKKEVLELAKKCGAEFAKTFDGEELVQFTGAQLEEYTAALEEKHQAQIAMLGYAGRALIDATNKTAKAQAEANNAEENYSDTKDYDDRLINALVAESEASRNLINAIADTQQSSEAFLAEVRAKALEDAAEVMSRSADYEMDIPVLRRIASELRDSTRRKG